MTELRLAPPTLSAIERLAAHHEATRFDCGRPDLNRFLQRFALPGQKAGSSSTLV